MIAPAMPQPASSMPSQELKTKRFDPEILREYDIRGQVGKNLSESDAYTLGLSFGTMLSAQDGKTICVGYDGRLTSPALTDALIKGLMETGLDVTAIGLGPSPMLYFAVKHLKSDAGIMVTGSHNPSDYNGFKMQTAKGSVFGEQIQDLGKIAESGDFANGEGSLKEVDLQEDYIERLLQDLNTDKTFKIAWDAGNGAAGEILKKLTARLPGEHILLYDDIDGAFPNHHPDPTVDKNLADLRQAVLDNKCDFGIAFDGDGDRIGALNEKGEVLRCDTLLTIYAAEILKSYPGAPIIGDVKCSHIMFEEIERLGGQPVMWKTGHSLIKSKMAELNAPLAGELSGHIFFNDIYYGYDDALYCGIRLINAVAAADKPLSDMTAHLPKLHSTPEIRIDMAEDEKFKIAGQIVENIKRSTPAGTEISDIDGVRVTNADGWWLLRPSNTQAALVMRAESETPDGLKRLLDSLTKELAKCGQDITLEV